jgi:hypothetical protein
MAKRWFLMCALLIGCRGQQQQQVAAAPGDPAFDAKWKALESQGSEPAFIESPRGGGLMGEVRRAVDTPRTPLVAADGVMQGPLPDPEVVKVIRSNLGAVRGCFAAAERAAAVGSGKAIVSLDIDGAGTVSNVSVEAPTFTSSPLPNCIGGVARAWTFPKFSQGPKHFSYPLVFVGG